MIVRAAQGFAIDRAIMRQILARDVSVRLRHVVGVEGAEGAIVQQVRSFACNAAQCLCIVAGDQACAGLDRFAIGEV